MKELEINTWYRTSTGFDVLIDSCEVLAGERRHYSGKLNELLLKWHPNGLPYPSEFYHPHRIYLDSSAEVAEQKPKEEIPVYEFSALNFPYPGSIFEHYSHLRYEVCGHCYSTVTGEPLVLYRAANHSKLDELWARPLSEFMGYTDDHKKRFTFICNKEILDLANKFEEE